MTIISYYSSLRGRALNEDELIEYVKELESSSLGQVFKREATERHRLEERLREVTADNERLLSLLRTAMLERDAFLGKEYALPHLTKCQECGSHYDADAQMRRST